MKILKHGNTYKKTTCDECSAELEYTAKDIKTQEIDYPFDDEYHTTFKYIACPECGNKIILEEKFYGPNR